MTPIPAYKKCRLITEVKRFSRKSIDGRTDGRTLPSALSPSFAVDNKCWTLSIIEIYIICSILAGISCTRCNGSLEPCSVTEGGYVKYEKNVGFLLYMVWRDNPKNQLWHHILGPIRCKNFCYPTIKFNQINVTLCFYFYIFCHTLSVVWQWMASSNKSWIPFVAFIWLHAWVDKFKSCVHGISCPDDWTYEIEGRCKENVHSSNDAWQFGYKWKSDTGARNGGGGVDWPQWSPFWRACLSCSIIEALYDATPWRGLFILECNHLEEVWWRFSPCHFFPLWASDFNFSWRPSNILVCVSGIGAFLWLSPRSGQSAFDFFTVIFVLLDKSQLGSETISKHYSSNFLSDNRFMPLITRKFCESLGNLHHMDVLKYETFDVK